jgi:hypothetical protein
MIPLLSKDFTLPADGWYQLTPEGEFLHKPTGILQVVDTAACEAIVSDFTARAAAPDFGGVLVDYDHFSMDPERPSEAAGWIMETQHRPGSGVWARIRWTDEGEKAVTGGRYRYMSPVWMPADCETLAPDKLRPLRLKNAALTNAPNIVGAAPLSNDVRIVAPPHIAAFLANRALGALTNALTPGHTAQRRAFFAKLRGSPTAAAGKTPAGRPAEQPARPVVNPLRPSIPGDTTLPVDDGRRVPGVPENAIPVNQKKPAQPARPGGAYPMPIVGPGRPVTPGRPGDIWIGGSPDFDERTGRYRDPNDPRNRKLGLPTIRPGASIGDRLRQLFANRAMTDAQRRAMFARLRSGSGPNPRDYEPKTPAEVDQDAEAERELTAGEREQNLALSRIIARRKAIEADNARNKPELPGDAEARRRAAGVGVAKKAGPEQDGIQAKAKGRQVARVDMPVDPDRKPNPNSLTAGRGLQWRGPVAQTAAGRRAEEEGRQRAVRDWLRDLVSRGALHNRSPMSDEQRKAMFARMRGGSVGASRSWEPGSPELDALRQKTPKYMENYIAERIAAGEDETRLRTDLLDVADTLNGMALGSVGGLRTVGTKAAVAGSRNVTGIINKARQLLTGKPANGMVHPELPALDYLRTSADKIRAATVGKLGYVDEATSQALRALRIEGDAIRSGATSRINLTAPLSDASKRLLDWVRTQAQGQPIRILDNRSPMTDNQRKAMFARMNYQGRGAPDPAPAATGAPAQGAPASSTPAADMVRQNQARLDALHTQRTNLEAQAPKRPEPTVPDLAEVDPRAARQAALAAGGDATAVLQAEQTARERNLKAVQWRAEMERTLTARGVRPENLNAAIQRELDKMAGADAKATKDYEKAQDRHLKALAAIDAKIAAEEIAGQEAELRHRNAAAEVQTRTAAAAEKATAAAAAKAAADKAKAEAAAAKARAGDPDPVKQVAAVKKQRAAYLDAIVLGELDVAERLAPGVNHRANIAAVRAMIPRLGQPMSTRDRASAAEALRILAQTAPDAYPRTK